ncbi:protein LLP homolog isoform X2 [Halyomorpha halys]|nr:protein LLP homolog [Halyomorpha halys]XP_014287530.1 protein LLP homolog [Halyomorpha halys]XP_014287531.1 protein LLP homolog [Halyomorpha halys]XP_014287532.1 protein LLP homolog [Halyomorpha halys]
MAKSLRSKWKRKMRAIKRERYGKKELEKLKTILNNAVDNDSDVNMSSLADVVQVVSKPAVLTDEEPMETNDNASNSGNKTKYPIWLGSSKRKKLIKRNKQLNKIKKKELKKSQKKRR